MRRQNDSLNSETPRTIEVNPEDLNMNNRIYTSQQNIQIRDSIYGRLNHQTAENTPWMSVEGQVCQCKVVDVYDGDTVTLIFPMYGKLVKHRCRLAGINCAEMRTRNPVEKEVALKTKDFVEARTLNKIIYMKCGDWGNFGRLLGTLYLTKDDLDRGKSLNQAIIDRGLAYEYDGKSYKKKKFEEWWGNKVSTSSP
jgi:endonuclease YncB( thermonuclease family)